MSEDEPVLEVTEPGVYDGIPDELYHGDPVPDGSLSVSGAKVLLDRCPAIFVHQRTHGRPQRRVFDFGHAAHQLVLGTGPEIVVVQAEDWRTSKAKAERDEAYTRGAVPVLAREYEQVKGMAAAIQAHPIASVLFQPGSGFPEQSLFVRDGLTGVMLRGRSDWLPAPRQDGRLIIPDYKTADSADPEAFRRAAVNFGYHMQDPWYCDLARLLGLADDPAFVFVVQEKTAPYLVSVIELDATAKTIGRDRNRQAIDLYAECVETNTWPGYTTDVALIGLPAWYERQNLEAS